VEANPTPAFLLQSGLKSAFAPPSTTRHSSWPLPTIQAPKHADKASAIRPSTSFSWLQDRFKSLK